MTIHKGGCHCGRVRFEVEAPEVTRRFDAANWEDRLDHYEPPGA